jgi:hypothetical protein
MNESIQMTSFLNLANFFVVIMLVVFIIGFLRSSRVESLKIGQDEIEISLSTGVNKKFLYNDVEDVIFSGPFDEDLLAPAVLIKNEKPIRLEFNQDKQFLRPENPLWQHFEKTFLDGKINYEFEDFLLSFKNNAVLLERKFKKEPKNVFMFADYIFEIEDSGILRENYQISNQILKIRLNQGLSLKKHSLSLKFLVLEKLLKQNSKKLS